MESSVDWQARFASECQYTVRTINVCIYLSLTNKVYIYIYISQHEACMQAPLLCCVFVAMDTMIWYDMIWYMILLLICQVWSVNPLNWISRVALIKKWNGFSVAPLIKHNMNIFDSHLFTLFFYVVIEHFIF